MKYNFNIHVTSGYNTQYAIIEYTRGRKVTIVNAPTTCTDYLTDELMYPSSIFSKNSQDWSKKFKLLVVDDIIKLTNFVKFGLPILHKIEKLNHYKLTKVVHNGIAMVVVPSKMWVRSTYALSIYLKLFRNLSRLTVAPPDYDTMVSKFCIQDINDFTKEDLKKIIFTGKISQVNRGCSHVHGWRDKNTGEHSNNGVSYTHKALEVLAKDYSKLPAYEKHRVDQLKTFQRVKNLRKLQKQLAGVDTNALCIL